MQHDAGAGLAGSGEGAPAERRVDVVGVHDPRSSAAHRLPHLLGPDAAAQQPGGGAAVGERGGVALEHLDVLAEVLTNQPREVFDRAFLPAWVAVAVVQKKNHGDPSVRTGRTSQKVQGARATARSRRYPESS